MHLRCSVHTIVDMQIIRAFGQIKHIEFNLVGFDLLLSSYDVAAAVVQANVVGKIWCWFCATLSLGCKESD